MKHSVTRKLTETHKSYTKVSMKSRDKSYVYPKIIYPKMKIQLQTVKFYYMNLDIESWKKVLYVSKKNVVSLWTGKSLIIRTMNLLTPHRPVCSPFIDLHYLFMGWRIDISECMHLECGCFTQLGVLCTFSSSRSFLHSEFLFRDITYVPNIHALHSWVYFKMWKTVRKKMPPAA